jgi:hypothetical protein
MDEPPKSLFKYVTPARVDILATEKVAFTPPERFNDILDVRPHVVPMTNREYLLQIEKEAQAAFVASLPPWQQPKTAEQRRRLFERLGSAVDHVINQAPEMAQRWQAELPKLISGHFGVLCFSETNDHHLMWAHYAAEHNGFVIEFDTAHPAFHQLGEPRKVEYLPHRPVYDAAKGAMGFWRQKTEQWAYEREWRIVRELKHCETKTVNGSAIYLCPLPRSAVRAVYFGVRASTETEKQVRAALQGTRTCLHRARIDGTSGHIVFSVVEA